MSVEVCGDPLDRLPFEGVLGRFLHHFARLLREELTEQDLELDIRDTAVDSLLVGLAERLAAVSHRTLVCVLAQERSAGRLRGADPSARYTDFDRRFLDDPAYLEQVFTMYPLLGRCLVESGRRWLRASLELLRHLAADLDVLQDAGLATGDRRVDRIRSDMGDPHNGGRAVAQVTFADGSSVVHKPRPVETERLYEDLALVVARMTPEITLRPMRVLPRDGYGWCELIERADCRDENEVRQFYRNSGAALAVLHVLGAIDMHMGNIIAAGASPVPVDLETVLQPTEIRNRPSSTANEKALDRLAASVLATGVLPLRMFGDGIDAGVDVSAVGGGAPQTSPRPLPTLVDPFTDHMRVEGRFREMGASSNRPRLAGGAVDPADHIDEIVSGFCGAYDTVASNQSLIRKLLEQSSGMTVRHLVRNTRRYDLFRYERFHPDYLQDGCRTDKLLDKLWTAAVTRPDLIPLVESERQALLDMDIPSFTTRPGDCALRAAGRPVVNGFFAEPSATTLAHRLAGFGAAHRSTQVAILEDALGLLRGPQTVRRPAPRGPVTPSEPATDDDIRALIRRTLDDLADRALLGADDCTWIGVGVDGIRDETLAVKPLTTSLYDGLAGMALVFGYAARMFDDERYAEIGRRSAEPVAVELAALVRQQDTGRCIGAFAGSAGSVYALHHVGALDGDRYGDLIGAALRTLRHQAEREHSPDVVTGLAGCAVVATGLIADYGDPAIALVRRCVDRLAAGAVPIGGGVGWRFRDGVPPLGGFAHGAAGIGWALLTAGRSLEDEDVTELGGRALRYDDGLRAVGEDGWEDLRGFVDRTGIAQHRPTLWCHGATGIGISRLLSDRITGRSDHVESARAAVRATCAASPLVSQGLCHGDSGSVEFLDLAATLLADHPEAARARRTARCLVSSIVTGVRDHGFDFGPISGPNLPGLMMGRAGVALSLMRQLSPDNAPAVLWLEPFRPAGVRQVNR